MRRPLIWLLKPARSVGLAFLLMAAPAAAQVVVPTAPPSPPEIDYEGDEVGTAESSVLESAGELRSGTGALRRDTGAGELYRSMAAVNLQEAVEEYLKNQVARVEAYRLLRQKWKDTREELRRQPLTLEGYRRIAQRRSPDRLSADNFNPETGEILWPPPLDAPQLKDHRAAIEQQFARRASSGHRWSTSDYHQVNAHVQVMVRAVRAVEELLSPNEFAALLQMLEAIEWEAQHDSSGERLALLGAPAQAAEDPQTAEAQQPAGGQQPSEERRNGQQPPAQESDRSAPSKPPAADDTPAADDQPVVPPPPQPAPESP